MEDEDEGEGISFELYEGDQNGILEEEELVRLLGHLDRFCEKVDVVITKTNPTRDAFIRAAGPLRRAADKDLTILDEGPVAANDGAVVIDEKHVSNVLAKDSRKPIHSIYEAGERQDVSYELEKWLKLIFVVR